MKTIDSPSVPSTANARNEGAILPYVAMCGQIRVIRAKDSRTATQQGYAFTQDKVLVIMDYAIFQKQAYSGTGSQRDSIPGVTDSAQKG
jgi:hypothetical protein